MASPHHVPALSIASFDEFCNDWIAAWNAHDLERILSHYREDVLFTSPFAARAGARDGVLHGLPALVVLPGEVVSAADRWASAE